MSSEPPSKKQKKEEKQPISSPSTINVNIPDQDIDDLIGDLIKEELQLLITRMIKKTPKFIDELKPQIVRIIKSRARQTPNPKLNQQEIQKLSSPQQLFQATQSLAQQLGMTQQDVLGGFSQPVSGSQILPFLSALKPGQSGFLPDIDQYGVDVAAIRRKVRDAITPITRISNKRKFGAEQPKVQYRVNALIIQQELQNAKDSVMKSNEVRKGLSILEAVTSEYTLRGTELGEQNITGYTEVLDEIAKSWVEIFLHENLNDMAESERNEWSQKLFNWDKSASEEEGTFSISRAAAKLGWNDTHLKQVLKGEHIGKFKEPVALSIARLNQLERENRFSEGLNLAKAVDQHFYTAKFLLKLDKLKEAEKVSMEQIEDHEKLFSLAQVARSSDVKIAFNLTMKSIGLAHIWNQQIEERSIYLCDLCIANGLLDTLIEQIDEKIRHKTVQFNIAKILKEKEKFKYSLEICKMILKPYPVDEEKQKKEEEEEKKKTPEKISTLQPVIVAPEVDPGTIIPSEVPTWMWSVIHEMVLLDLSTEKEMISLVRYILENVEDTNQLMDLIRVMFNKLEYELILIVGMRIFELLKKQQEKEFEDQKKVIAEIIKNPNAQLENPLLPPVPLMYNQKWDISRYQAASQMINAVLRSREEKPVVVKTKKTTKEFRDVQPVSDEKLSEVVESCLDNITNIDHLSQLIHSFQGLEYSMVIKIAEKIFIKAEELKSQKLERQKLSQELQLLREEEAELAKKRKKLKSIQRKRLEELTFQERLWTLLPYSAQYNEQRYNQIQLQAATNAINAALNSRIAKEENKRMNTTQIEQVVESCIKFIKSPYDITTLMTNLRNKGEYELVSKIGEYAFSITSKLYAQLEEKFKIQVPYNLLLEEQEELLARKKQLEGKKAKELERLKKELEKLPTQEYYDPGNSDGYENLNYSIASIMIDAALDSKNFVPSLQPKQTGNIPVIERVPITNEKFEQLLRNCLNYVKNPANIIALGRLISNNVKLYEYVLITGKTCFERIKYLVEEREKRGLPKLKLNALIQERDKLASVRKFLSKEDQIELKELQFQERMNGILPSYYNLTASKYDSLFIQTAQLMINSVIAMRNELKAKLQELEQRELTKKEESQNDYSQSQLEDVDMKDHEEEEEETKESLQEKIKQIGEKIKETVDLILKYVSNPNDLNNLQYNLKSNAEYMHVLTIGKFNLNRVQTVIKERDERQKIIDELQQLQFEENEIAKQRKQLMKQTMRMEPEKIARMKELSMKTEMFKLLPAYTKNNDNKFDTIILKSVQGMIDATYDAKNDELSKFEEEQQIDEKLIELHNSRIKEIANLGLKYILNPEHITIIVSQIRDKQDYSLMIHIGKRAIERINECSKIRRARDEIRVQRDLLIEEENQLQLLRKQLEPELQEKLTKLQDELDNTEIPYYCFDIDIDQFDNLKYSVGWNMLEGLLEEKSNLEEKIASADNEESNIEESKLQLTKIIEQIKQVQTFIFSEDGIQNPISLQKMCKNVHKNHKEYTLAIEIGDKCLERIKQFRKEVSLREKPNQQYAELKNEQNQLLTRRQQLSIEQQKLLRDLELQYKLYLLNPTFTRKTSDEYDKIAFNCAKSMIEAAKDAAREIENKMELDSGMTETQINIETQNVQKQMQHVIQMALENVITINHLMRLTNELANQVEYSLVLTVGAKAQQRIFELISQIEKIEKITAEKQQLLQQQKIKPSEKNQKRIEEIDSELQNLPQTYDPIETINESLLSVATQMMNAAKVEQKTEIQREQAVIIFKITMTNEAFGEVKVLTPEDEWPKVRKELLDYVMNKNKDREGDKKLDMQQIELLLNEGLFKECIDGFPEPTEDLNCELLERLWVEIDKRDPSQLQKLLPVVEKYATRAFKQYELEKTEGLLNLVEAYDPNFMVSLFHNVVQQLLVSIVQKQYKPFIEFLELVKTRLTKLNMSKEWDKFIDTVKKKNKGKKKLMQMISMENY